MIKKLTIKKKQRPAITRRCFFFSLIKSIFEAADGETANLEVELADHVTVAVVQIPVHGVGDIELRGRPEYCVVAQIAEVTV